MGEDWRMPTDTDFRELLNGTTQAWITNYNDSGINGYLFTSKINDNTLFIPVAGRMVESSIESINESGFVWSSSLSQSQPYYSQCLAFVSRVIIEAPGDVVKVIQFEAFVNNLVNP